MVPWWVRKRLRLKGESKADKAAVALKPARKPAKTLDKNVQVRCMPQVAALPQPQGVMTVSACAFAKTSTCMRRLCSWRQMLRMSTQRPAMTWPC